MVPRKLRKEGDSKKRCIFANHFMCKNKTIHIPVMRNQESTKHDYGHGLLIAGAYGKAGCAILAARAALRSGCGLVTAHLPQRCIEPMQAAFPEAMVSIDPSPTLFTSVPEQLEHYTAIAIGPGIGTAPATAAALHKLLETRPVETPLVLDADAINLLAMHREWLPLAQGAVITPHAREYARLFGDAEPAEMARKHNITIVRKAHRTRIYSPDEQVTENQTGNAGMATAGSGDVLTGIMLGMLCANHLHASTYETVCRAVEIHGKTGDISIEKQSESSLIASDLIENLRHVSTDMTDN